LEKSTSYEALHYVVFSTPLIRNNNKIIIGKAEPETGLPTNYCNKSKEKRVKNTDPYRMASRGQGEWEKSWV
jgi:hypothetical protein